MKIKTYKKFYESIGSPLLDLSDNVDHHLISQIQKNVKPSASILEISCGNGSDSLYLKELGFRVTCTELNPEYVKNAKNLGLNCIEHNSKDKFPFKDKEFDLVYSRLGLHYFTEQELYDIFYELKRIGEKILITVKVVDDIKTGKIILGEDKWKEIISNFFNIKSFEVKEGQLYGNQTKWIEILGDNPNEISESKVYNSCVGEEFSEEIIEDIEQMKNTLVGIEDFENIPVHFKKEISSHYTIEVMINKDSWHIENTHATFKLTKNIHDILLGFKNTFTNMGYEIKFNYMSSGGNWYKLFINEDGLSFTQMGGRCIRRIMINIS
jgi:SAM-dependent methyltransferase